jgi:hypothetical protein
LAFDSKRPIGPPACSVSSIGPAIAVSARASSRISPERAARACAIRRRTAARSAGFIHGHGPSSNARRADSAARVASFADPIAAVPITTSVEGQTTSTR